MQQKNCMKSAGEEKRKRAKQPIVPFFLTNAHCEGKCSFCDQVAIEGVPQDTFRAFEDLDRRLASISNIPSEIALYGGDILGFSEEEIKSIFSALEEKVRGKFGRSIKFRVSASPSVINREKLRLARSLDVQTVEVGVVSMDESILKRSRRGYGQEDAVKSIRLVKEMGFNTGVQLMAGLPGDDLNIFTESVEISFQQRPHFARLYPFIVIKGTEFGDAYDTGAYIPKNSTFMVQASAMFIIESIRWRVKVARIGIDESGLDETRVLHRPYEGNLRQDGEGKALFELLRAITHERDERCNVTVPRTFQTSLQREIKRRGGIRKIQETYNIGTIEYAEMEGCFHLSYNKVKHEVINFNGSIYLDKAKHRLKDGVGHSYG